MPEDSQDLTDIKLPYRVEDVTLMTPGRWNNREYDSEVVQEAVERTNFEEDHNSSIFYEHDDEDSRSWIGEVKNPRFEDGEVVGDLELVDEDAARKLEYGAHFGISPKVKGARRGDKMTRFTYGNFSLVIDPAVKTTYLNSEMEVMKMSDKDNTAETVEEHEDGTEDYGPVLDGDELPENPRELADVLSEYDSDQLKELMSELLESHDGDMPDEEDDEDEDMADDAGGEGSDADVGDDDQDGDDTMTEETTEEDVSNDELGDDFAEFAAEHSDLGPEKVVEKYKEAQKSPEEKAEEMAEKKIEEAKNELKSEFDSLKEELSSVADEVQTASEEMSEAKKASRRTGTKEDVQELSEGMSPREKDKAFLKTLQAQYRGHSVSTDG